MTSEEQTLDVINNFISHLPEKQQLDVNAIAASIREFVKGRGGNGMIALSLIGAEFAAGKYD